MLADAKAHSPRPPPSLCDAVAPLLRVSYSSYRRFTLARMGFKNNVAPFSHYDEGRSAFEGCLVGSVCVHGSRQRVLLQG